MFFSAMQKFGGPGNVGESERAYRIGQAHRSTSRATTRERTRILLGRVDLNVTCRQLAYRRRVQYAEFVSALNRVKNRSAPTKVAD